MNSLRLTASLLALAIAAPALASDDHACIDEQCTMLSLFDQPAASGGSAQSTEATRMGAWGIDTAGMDKSVKPGDDFFGYVNGNWAKNTPIPADRSSYGGFAGAARPVGSAHAQLVEGYKVGNPARDGDQAKVAALYRGFLDEAAIEKLDAKPLQPKIAKIRAVRNKDGMARLMGEALGGGFGGSFFGRSSTTTARTPIITCFTWASPGSACPIASSTFRRSSRRRRRAISNMSRRCSAWPAGRTPKLLPLRWSRSRPRSPTRIGRGPKAATATRPTIRQLWASFRKPRRASIGRRSSMPAGSARPRRSSSHRTRLSRSSPRYSLRPTSKRSRLAGFPHRGRRRAAPLQALRRRQFRVPAEVLNGQPEQRDRWKRAVAIAEASMGEAIGRDYVKLYYPPESKAKMDKLVADLRVAMRKRIEGLEWMSPATKVQALDKLQNFGLKIGHPDEWRDYSRLQIRNGDLFGNVERAAKFEWDYRRNRLGQRVDEKEWGMTPQTVNAYYSPVKNEIVFPAAILQPPFFDPNADPAVNYGAIGGVIGHEISHGFDDQGRKSDGKRHPARLVDCRGRRQVRGAGGQARRAVRGLYLPDPARHGHQRPRRDGREYRRSRRHPARPRSLSQLSRRQARAGDRRLHRRAAAVHGLGAGVAALVARRCAQAADHQRPALARPDPRLRALAQRRRLV
jgi:putative endopeptidase